VASVENNIAVQQVTSPVPDRFGRRKESSIVTSRQNGEVLETAVSAMDVKGWNDQDQSGDVYQRNKTTGVETLQLIDGDGNVRRSAALNADYPSATFYDYDGYDSEGLPLGLEGPAREY